MNISIGRTFTKESIDKLRGQPKMDNNINNKYNRVPHKHLCNLFTLEKNSPTAPSGISCKFKVLKESTYENILLFTTRYRISVLRTSSKTVLD
jgi:hypothetical protein